MLSCLGQEAPGMVRTVASLPAGSRIADYISLGLIEKAFPLTVIHLVLAKTRAFSQFS